ncbi:MAG: response regulator [Treponema sp.]|jgi:two-component SAPR family response regulator|nr:response regulator [Treponema sp.]
MNIIAVDDEQYALAGLKSAIESATLSADCLLSCFNNSEDALEYAKTSRVDIAFLDIEMSDINGLQLAKQLKDIYGKTFIVFVTGHSQYAVDAFALRAKGYIMKPFAAEAVAEAIQEAAVFFNKNNLDKDNLDKDNLAKNNLASKPKKRIHVQTFGNFEVFLDGKMFKFKRTKTKELFAYLVSRKGAACNNNEIIAALWEGKKDTNVLQTMLRQLVLDLTQKLDEAGLQDILIKERAVLAVVPDEISCDFYDFCAGLNVNNYMGEFMSQYSWAEFAVNYLDRMYKKAMK